MADRPAVLNLDDSRRLVRRRANVQLMLLRIHGLHPRDEDELARFRLLVAVGVSLWRAVFLVDDGGGRRGIASQARRLLQYLIGEEGIGDRQDRLTPAWTFGYYVYNAAFRLQMIYRNLGGKSLLKARVDQFLAMQSAEQSGSKGAALWEGWDLAYSATEEILDRIAPELVGV